MSNPDIRVATCQVPDIRQRLEESLSWIEEYAEAAADAGACLVCFPECFLQGYLLEEEQARRNAIELRSPAFAQLLKQLAAAKPAIVFGMIEIEGECLFNTAVAVHRGRLIGSYRKMHLLPGESIFQSGASCPVFAVDDLKFGINICFDTQFPESAAAVARQGARLIVCPSNNMMRREKAEKWRHLHNQVRACRARETALWLISSDVTGVRADSVALGPTCVIDPHGSVVAQVPSMETGMVVAAISNTARSPKAHSSNAPPLQ